MFKSISTSYKFCIVLLILVIDATLHVRQVHASQEKDVKNRDTITLTLSSKDPNIVSITDDRIKQYSVVKGVATASIDNQMGILNVKPTGLYNDRPFSMIIFTEKGNRYTLLFVPKKVPAQDILLNNAQDFEVTAKDNANKKSLYTSSLANLIKLMIKGGEIERYKKTIIEQKIKDDNNLEIKLNPQIEVNYIGNDYTGEVLTIKNNTDKDLKLQEKQFYRNGVLAIALSATTLRPFETANVYRVVHNG